MTVPVAGFWGGSGTGTPVAGTGAVVGRYGRLGSVRPAVVRCRHGRETRGVGVVLAAVAWSLHGGDRGTTDWRGDRGCRLDVRIGNLGVGKTRSCGLLPAPAGRGTVAGMADEQTEDHIDALMRIRDLAEETIAEKPDRARDRAALEAIRQAADRALRVDEPPRTAD